jgi:hypothetical protein
MLSLLRLLAFAALVVAGLDAALFRSGFYYRWLEPDSTAGSATHAIDVAQKLWREGPRNVLVIGDSRIGAGFSDALADAAVEGSNLHFIGLAIPGSTPKVWPHVVDAFDLAAHRLAAIVFTVTDLDDVSQSEDMDCRALDLAYLAPLLRMSDLVDLPWTFHDADLVQRAVRQILLPGTAMRDDVVRFLAMPGHRIEQVQAHRRAGVEWQIGYGGETGRIDADVGRVWADKHADPAWWGYFGDLARRNTPRPPAETAAYRRRHFGGLAQRCRAAGASMLLVPIPRGPFHRAFGQDTGPVGSLADMAREGACIILDRAPSRQLKSRSTSTITCTSTSTAGAHSRGRWRAPYRRRWQGGRACCSTRFATGCSSRWCWSWCTRCRGAPATSCWSSPATCSTRRGTRASRCCWPARPRRTFGWVWRSSARKATRGGGGSLPR